MPIGEITTERLRIRDWTAGDIEAFHLIWGDPIVIWWGHSTSLDQTRAILDNLIERGRGTNLGWCAVETRRRREVVGNVCLQRAPEPRGDIEIGWHFTPTAQGKGYATEAAAALLDYGFSAGFDYIVADIVPGNAASQKVAMRLGMERTGMVDRAGLIHDVWVIDAHRD